MKRAEITVPKTHADKAEEVIEEYEEDITSSEAEKDDQKYIQFQVTLSSDAIDEMTQDLKDITELDSGELTIEILEETAHIEKGKRREGGSPSLSVQEMYEKAFEFSAYNISTWTLIALGAGIAVFGVAIENVTVVIGAMVIAPMLGPFISTSFGLVIGDRQLIRDSMFYAAASLFIATAAAFVVSLPLPIQANPLMRLIANPGFMTIPLSLFVGAAAALTFAAESREALAGVAVAIALVPPTAVAGAALAIPDFQIFFDVSLVIVTNVTSLILAGSLTFKAYGIAPSTYYRQQVSDRELKKALAISIVSILVIGGVVGYFSLMDYQDTAAKTSIQSFIDDQMGDRVLESQVTVKGERLEVSIAAVEPEYTEERLEEIFGNMVDRPVDVKLLRIKGD